MFHLSSHNTKVDAMFIQEVNFAALELKHFIHLNAKLLPLFVQLSSKETNTYAENLQKIKIRETLEKNSVDEAMSFIFFNSPILCMINDCHDAIVKKSSLKLIQLLLKDFLFEYDVLLKKWDCITKN